MTIEMRLFPGAVSGAAGEPASAASARAAEDGPSSGAPADGDAAPGTTEACFAALVAWLMQVSPAAEGDAAEAASGDRRAAGSAAIARAPLGTTLSPLDANGASDVPNAPNGESLLARAVFSMASAKSDTAPAGATEPASPLPTPAGESSARSSGPLDLSFLGVAPAAAPARDLPAAPAAASAEPRAQFAAELGQRVVTMVEQGVNDARLRVHPEHLGPIEIRVRLDGDSAQVAFHSAHGAVRDALADAVPRLRELLGAAGFGLEHVDIGAGDPQGFGTPDGDARDADAVDRSAGASSAEAPAELDEPERRVAMTHGLVDTFA